MDPTVFANQPAHSVSKLNKLLGPQVETPPPVKKNVSTTTRKEKEGSKERERVDRERSATKERTSDRTGFSDFRSRKKTRTGAEGDKSKKDLNAIHEDHTNKEDYVIPKELTLDELIEKVTSESCPTSLQQQFLLVYRTICSPSELLGAILKRMETCKASAILLRYWVDNFWSDFSIHKQTLLPEIESFSSAHLPTSDVNLLLHGVKKRIAFNTEKFESVIKQTIFIGDSLAEYSGNLNIWDVESDEIAQQITIIDESLFKAIGLEEFMGQAWTKKDKETRAPNILRFISWFNEISYWIQTELTKEVRLKSRIRKFAKFLDICEFLLAYQNYNSLLAFFSAFLSSSIHRMQKTIAGLPKRHNSFYKKYIQLLDGRDRWAWARGQISSAEGPCLPYLGMYLTDYTMIDDGNKDNTPNGLINYRKRELIASCLQTIVDCQQKPYLHFNVNSEIQEYLLRCKRCRNTDSLFSFSKIAEPKENEPTFEVAVIDKTNEEFIEKYIGKDTFEHLKSEKLSKSKTVKKSVYFKRAKTVDMLRDDIDHDVDVPSDLGQLIQEMEEDYDSQISALQDMIEQMRKQLEVSEATLSKVQREKKRMISRLHKFNEIQRMRQDEDRFDMSENRERSSESQTVSPSPYTSRRNIQLHDSGYLKDSQIVQPDLVQ